MNVSRRRVLKGVAAAGVLPLFNIGCAGFGQGRAVRIAKGDKLRVALIGCGIQGRTIINAVLLEKLVAIVDPDPSQLERMDKEVAALNDAACSANYAGVRKFATYQDMFNAVGDGLDAVIIETPNHQHILPALMAIRRGIHVFLDKPLVLTVAEGDLLLAETRKRHGIVTQVGTYGHTFPSMTYCVDRIREGALGEVTEVWAYDDRCNSVYTRPGAVPPPKGMDWDAWCGGSPICDFYPESSDQDGMHPHGWHSWIGYGNGSIGNLGMHIMDVAFYALGLKDPDRVTCHDAQFACEGAWAYRDVSEFHFYKNGVLFVGTKANLWFTHHGGFRFMPRSAGWCMPRLDRPDDFNYRRNTLPHVREFYTAIRERREANDNFEYGVPLAKTVCLGNISSLAGKGSVLAWDGSHVTNDAKADAWITKTYRKGWNPFEQ